MAKTRKKHTPEDSLAQRATFADRYQLLTGARNKTVALDNLALLFQVQGVGDIKYLIAGRRHLTPTDAARINTALKQDECIRRALHAQGWPYSFLDATVFVAPSGEENGKPTMEQAPSATGTLTRLHFVLAYGQAIGLQTPVSLPAAYEAMADRRIGMTATEWQTAVSGKKKIPREKLDDWRFARLVGHEQTAEQIARLGLGPKLNIEVFY